MPSVARMLQSRQVQSSKPGTVVKFRIVKVWNVRLIIMLKAKRNL